ncbi:MFS transporter, partial [Pseudomonas aeruginosa]|nr:MFS transporter [Pseudomonas aeruginosa]
ALGNVAAGFILSRGIRPGALLASTAILMGLTGAAFFHAAMPGLLAIALGFVFSAVASTVVGSMPATAETTNPSAIASSPGIAAWKNAAPVSPIRIAVLASKAPG